MLITGGEGGFEEWKSSFDIQSHQADISSLLVSCSHVRNKHSQLVPAKVSYEAFWTRYFYRMKLLEKVCVIVFDEPFIANGISIVGRETKS